MRNESEDVVKGPGRVVLRRKGRHSNDGKGSNGIMQIKGGVEEQPLVVVAVEASCRNASEVSSNSGSHTNLITHRPARLSDMVCVAGEESSSSITNSELLLLLVIIMMYQAQYCDSTVSPAALCRKLLVYKVFRDQKVVLKLW